MKKVIAALGLVVAASLAPAAAFAQIGIGISVGIAPPPIPVYAQPPIPGPDYLWTPGYWAWNGDDYYWVPGAWVEAPQTGYLWTPGYWGWGDGGYVFHTGYWGPHIGFYGGIDYGFGYVGVGYRGGYWRDGHFAYNSAVNNINVNVIHNTYNERIVGSNGPRVGYNGGQGGVRAEPTPAERQAATFPHAGPTADQNRAVEAARNDRNQFASVNHGAPAVAATPRAGVMQGPGVVRATAPGGPVARSEARPGAGAPGVPQGARPPQSAEQNAARIQQQRAPGLAPAAVRPQAPAMQHAAPAARPQVSAPRPQAAAPRPAPAPRAEAPRPAPTPRAEAPRPAEHEAPRGGGGGGHEEHH
jgi:hypothetical protein